MQSETLKNKINMHSHRLHGYIRIWKIRKKLEQAKSGVEVSPRQLGGDKYGNSAQTSGCMRHRVNNSAKSFTSGVTALPAFTSQKLAASSSIHTYQDSGLPSKTRATCEDTHHRESRFHVQSAMAGARKRNST